MIQAWLAIVVTTFARCRLRLNRRRRVPVVLQLHATECGAACLAMVLGAWGRSVRLADLRETMGTGRDGVTANQIIAAATAQGLRMQAFALDIDMFDKVPLPAIVHWDFDHFVVVERWGSTEVTIVDPGKGHRRMPVAEFSHHFTGVVLACEPGEGFRRTKGAPPAWHRYLVSMLSQAPGLLAQVIGASLVLQLLGLALPLLTKVVVDDVLGREMHDLLQVIAVGCLAIVVAQCLNALLRSLLLLNLQARVDQNLMTGFFQHLLALPYRFFEQRTTGDLMMRLASNAQVREILTGQTLSVLIDGSLVVVFIAVLLAKEPAFGAVVLAVAVVQGILLFATRRAMHERTQRDLGSQSASQSYLVEALHGVATIKASGAEARVAGHWQGLFATQVDASVRRSALGAAIDAVVMFLRIATPLLLIWIGAQAVIDGRMTLGTMLALQALATTALAPVSSLVANGQRLQLVGAHLDRLGDVLDAEAEDVDGEPVALDGEIVLDRIGFRYDEGGPEVLHEVSFTIPAGSKVALVGPTGSGKSTLLRMLVGLHLPTSGEIRYGETSLAAADLAGLRRSSGVVMQDPVLFSGTILHNLTLNDPDLTLNQVVTAARIAGIHDEIAAMPMGYDTWLAEGGGGLSGGQRQRLTLARAIVHQPDLLLLDEATSALDVATEARIERNLRGLACTRVVVAHRLSTVQDADLIVHLEQGRVVEMGNHAGLLAANGPYADLVRRQVGEPALALAAD